MEALDLFAGTGWGVACKQLGIEEYGVENMRAAIETRSTNGMVTAFHDVWDGVVSPAVVPSARLHISSPPCQTFSVAGGGSGRKDLDRILGFIKSDIYTDWDGLLALRHEVADPRSALILTPLHYVFRDRPEHVVFEQVRECLPVWEACRVKLEEMGYEVITNVINSADYGVPQARKRAVLIASRTQTPEWPKKTAHIGWGEALNAPRDSVLVSNYSTTGNGYIKSGNKLPRGFSEWDQPSSTITSKAGSMVIAHKGVETNLTLDQAARLQSYPAGFKFAGKRSEQFLQVGNAVPPMMGKAILQQFA